MRNIVLRPEQQQLLATLIEADQKAPQRKFLVLETQEETFLDHAGLPTYRPNIYMGHIEALANAGLISLARPYNKAPNFDITPLGYAYYESLQQSGPSTDALLNQVLAAIVQVQGSQRNIFVDDTDIVHETGILIDDVRDLITILEQQGKVTTGNSHDGYSAMPTSAGRIALRDPHFATAATPTTSIHFSGTYSGAIFNINSTLDNVNQTIDAAPRLSDTAKEDLKALVMRLQEELQQAPSDAAEAAEAVADSAKDLVEAATKAQPNKTRVTITRDGLIKAAENIASVVPTLLPIATQIAQHVQKLLP